MLHSTYTFSVTPPWLVFQAPWVQQDVCATWPPEAWTAVKSCAAGEATTPPASRGWPSVSVSSTGAVLSAVRTAWRPWTCTRARHLRVPTGRLPHDHSGGHRPPSLPQGLHWIWRTLGLWVLSGRYFLRQGLNRSSSSLPGGPRIGPHATHRAGPTLFTSRTLGHISAWSRPPEGRVGVGPDHCLHPPKESLFWEHLAWGRRSVSSELSLFSNKWSS